jgi:hypothetical protein
MADCQNQGNGAYDGSMALPTNTLLSLKTRAIIGCDPGFTGALALVSDGVALAIEDMPVYERKGKTKLVFDAAGMPAEKHSEIHEIDYPALLAMLALWEVEQGPVAFVMEVPTVRPRQGISSAGRFMRNAGQVFGMAQGILGTSRCGLVHANRWKAAMKVTDDKATSLVLANRLAANFAYKLCKKSDHGRAEALLIALYASCL